MCFWLQVTEYAIKSGLNKEENSYAQKQEHLQDLLNQWLKDDTKDLGSSCLSMCQPRRLAFPLSLLPRSSKVVSVILDPMFSYNPMGRQKKGHFSLIVFLLEGSLFIRSSLADSPLSCYGQGITESSSVVSWPKVNLCVSKCSTDWLYLLYSHASWNTSLIVFSTELKKHRLDRLNMPIGLFLIMQKNKSNWSPNILVDSYQNSP